MVIKRPRTQLGIWVEYVLRTSHHAYELVTRAGPLHCRIPESPTYHHSAQGLGLSGLWQLPKHYLSIFPAAGKIVREADNSARVIVWKGGGSPVP